MEQAKIIDTLQTYHAHPARILLPEGSNGSSSSMRQNTCKHGVKPLGTERASEAPIPGPDMMLMLSSIELPKLLFLVPPLAIFIAVNIIS